jgi:membrane protein
MNDIARLRSPAQESRGDDSPDSGRPPSAPAPSDRSADPPSAVPRRGWLGTLLRVYSGINDDRILANAAAVTFYTLLALFPAIAALVSVYALFADPRTIAAHLDMLAGTLPGGAIDIIRDQLNRLTAQPGSKLGISFVLGLLISLWSANGGIKALFDALNVVYGERETRSFIRLNAISLTFTAVMIAFVIVALICIVALPTVLGYLPPFVGAVLDYARWPVLLVLVAVALAWVYRSGPDRAEPRWRWISWGSAFATIGWLAVSALFSWYAANFGSFNKTYGSLGAVIGFMMWIWLSVIIVLVGGKLNAETEHRPGRDTTGGQAKPLGARRAESADTRATAQN